MKGLIDEMLMLAQSENTSAASQAQMKELNLSDITTQACLTFDAVAFEAGVMMNDDIEQNLAINGDNTQITRLVKILIDNAIKYAGVNGTVDVGLHKTSKSKATLTVHNTGNPIPQDQLEHVFDRFWRSDESHTRTSNGSSYGLGLAIAKSICDSHNATISVTSTEQEGTTFKVDFNTLVK